jgi:hypothetical protein
MLFIVAPSGHEGYLQELAELGDRQQPPDPAAIAALNERYDIHEITPMVRPRRH